MAGAGLVVAETRTVTNTGDSGSGSLRDAISVAIAGDVIDFESGLSGRTITLTTGELLIDSELRIDASGLAGGLTVSAAGDSRVFQFGSEAVVQLEGLTVCDGQAPGGEHGGGIFNGGRLTLVACTVKGNRSGTPLVAFGPAGGGGGISSSKELLVVDSTISDNQASAMGGGILNSKDGVCRIERSTLSGNRAGVVNFGMARASGGGIFSEGDLEVIASTIASNECGVRRGDTIDSNPEPGGFGGGIYSAAPCKLVDCAVRDNRAGVGLTTFAVGGPGGSGGGIFSSATLDVIGSSISGNRAGDGGRGASDGNGAGGDGGGIYSLGACTIERAAVSGNVSGFGGPFASSVFSGRGGGIYAAGTLTMENTSVLDNSSNPDPGIDSKGGDGAGIYCSDRLVLSHCTVALNMTDDRRLTKGGGIAFASSTANVVIEASVVAMNVAHSSPDLTRDTLPVSFTVRGLNFVGEAADVEGFAGFISGDPMLSLPGDYGLGLTAMLPVDLSPLIDAAALGAGSPPTDQRGEMRLVPDIGAAELVASDSQFDIGGIGALAIAALPGRNKLEVRRKSARPLRVYYSPDLVEGSWIDIGAFTFSGTEPMGRFDDRSSSRLGKGRGFYRAVFR